MLLFYLYLFNDFIPHAVLDTIMEGIGGTKFFVVFFFFLLYKSMFYEERRKKPSEEVFYKNILQSGMKEINDVMYYVMRVPTMD